MEFDLSQFRDLFVDEGRQYLQTLNQSLLALEQTPSNLGLVEEMFRAAHSLKGGAATMGYDLLSELAHEAEDVLDHVRHDRWPLTAPVVELLFAALDVLQLLVDDVAADRPHTADVAGMLSRLRTPPAETDSVPAATPKVARPATAERSQPQTTVIRVDLRHVDRLFNIVAEMVIHRSLLARLGRRHGLGDLTDALQVHNRLLAQLRDAVLAMRMVPVNQVFDRFPRMVRDLLKAQGKEAQLVIEGAEVEMDRTALEALNDPLVHLLRNAVDHGLENPAERAAAGKPPAGMLHLTARRERESVIIELSDDGKGMDPQQIAAAAVEWRIITQEQAGEMSDRQILELICQPGFSLSREVTSISGRGVGMGVVREQVESLRGTLEIETRPGRGTTFRLKLPVMLALVNAMLIRLGNEQYALPLTRVERIIELDQVLVEQVGQRRVMSVQEGVVPLRCLGELLETPGADPNPRYALLIRRNDQALGLQIDEVLGREEVVAKPLPAALRTIPGMSGVTILGEGQTVLLLDVDELPL